MYNVYFRITNDRFSIHAFFRLPLDDPQPNSSATATTANIRRVKRTATVSPQSSCATASQSTHIGKCQQRNWLSIPLEFVSVTFTMYTDIDNYAETNPKLLIDT